MKLFKWRTFVATVIVCLLPILPGLALWDRLPEAIAIHFNIYGVADNYASKAFAVFGLPIMMSVIQSFCCIANGYKHSKCDKIPAVMMWIIPTVAVILQIATLGYNLGWGIDISKVAAFITGMMLLLTGICLPKYDKINGVNIDSAKACKINRFVGYETIVMGALFIISIFLPPICVAVCAGLLVPYIIIAVVYGIVVARN